jgi:protein gp37
MSKSTAIQWCDSSVNPVMGCAGCELWNGKRKICYAGNLHVRYPNNCAGSTVQTWRCRRE